MSEFQSPRVIKIEDPDKITIDRETKRAYEDIGNEKSTPEKAEKPNKGNELYNIEDIDEFKEVTRKFDIDELRAILNEIDDKEFFKEKDDMDDAEEPETGYDKHSVSPESGRNKERELEDAFDGICREVLVNIEDLSADNEDNSRPEKKVPKKKNKAKKAVLITAGAVVLLLIAVYVAGIFYFKDRFQPNTYIGSENVSFMKVEEAEKLFAQDSYTLTLDEIDGSSETIDLSSVGYDIYLTTPASEMLGSQNIYTWPIRLFSSENFSAGMTVDYDDDALEKAIKSLDAFDKKKITKPVNAYIRLNEEGHYEIVEEVNGNELRYDDTISCIKDVLDYKEYEVDLEDKGLYEKAEITKDDEALNETIRQYQIIGEETITIDLTGASEILKPKDVLGFVTIYDNDFTVNEASVREYVLQLALKYDTFMTARNFTTTSGQVIKVGGSILSGQTGDTYGFEMNQEETIQILTDAILAKTTQTIKPSWNIEGITRDKENADIGHTYIEISISEQHLWYYKDGVLTFDTDVITGLPSVEKRNSPEGVYRVITKITNLNLKGTMDGETWDSHVDYWLGFTWNGIGIHDASWQVYGFGGDVYTWNGSHGCINVAHDDMEQLYNMMEYDTPLIIYSFTDNHINSEGSHATEDYTPDEEYIEPETK